MVAELAAPSYGSTAVDKAAYQGAMAEAEVAPTGGTISFKPSMAGAEGGVSGSVNASEVVKQIGSKTFILRNGTWTDTTFDGAKMETVFVEFLSDDYFELISENPDLGDYFALGERVIVVCEGTAYEVGEA